MNSINKSKKQDYIWNTIAGCLNAGETVIMTIVVTRVTGIVDAGILTIAFALGNLFLTFGKYGVHNFQVTDVKGQFSFLTYFYARIITVGAMIVICAGYLAYAVNIKYYSWHKVVTIMLVCMIYAAEAMEDVYWGYMQNRGYLYKGAQMFCFRWGSILATFIVTLHWTKNLVLTLAISFGVSIFVLLLCVRIMFPTVFTEILVVDSKPFANIKSLLITTFPLFGSMFLTYYINNSAKYAIDTMLSDEIQAHYGFIAMPVFVTSLITSFIYQPYVVTMAKQWASRDLKSLKKRILIQILHIVFFTLCAVIGAYFLGVPILSWLYNTSLVEYRNHLCVLMLASGFLATSNFLGVVLNIMRLQKKQVFVNLFVGVLLFCSLHIVVNRFEVIGAALEYAIAMLLMCFAYLCLVALEMKRSCVHENNELEIKGRN